VDQAMIHSVSREQPSCCINRLDSLLWDRR